MHRVQEFAFLSLLVLILSTSPEFSAIKGKEIPNELRYFLLKHIRLNEKELTSIQSGQSIVRALPTEKREELAVFGIVHMKVPPEFFLSRFRNINKFESGPAVLQSGIFNVPPVMSDVSSLTWEDNDLARIRKCKPDNCSIRLPGGSISQIQDEVDWNSKKAIAQANVLLRRLAVEYITNYQTTGDDALTSYLIDGRLISVKAGLNQLLQYSEYLQGFPELVSYLRNFPKDNNSNIENLFYWQKAEFGLQPVIRFNHVVIFELNDSSTARYVIASKMLYANHYFRDGLELRSIIPDLENGTSKGFFFMALNRSHVDGMTGVRGRFIRGTTVKKTVQKLKEWLTKTGANGNGYTSKVNS